MGGNSLLAFFQNILTMITGPLGIIVMALAIGIAGALMAAGQVERGGFGRVVFGCGILYSCAWLAQTWTGGGF